MTQVYQDTVFPATRDAMEGQLGELANAPRSAQPAVIWNVESTSEFQTLEARTARLRELEIDVDRYNCFSPAGCTIPGSRLETFRQMIESVYRTRLRFPTSTSRHFYSVVLAGVGVDRYSGAGSRADLKVETVALSDAMFDRLFTTNVLVLALDDLAFRIDQLASQAPPAAAARESYQSLLTAIEGTEEDLTLPALAWAGAQQLELGDAFDGWLASIMSSGLGRETASEIRRLGDAGYTALRQRLAAACLAVGPLLAREEGAADDAYELALSPEVLALKSSLQNLLDQGFLQPVTGYGLSIEPPSGTALFWSSQPLDEASALVDSF